MPDSRWLPAEGSTTPPATTDPDSAERRGSRWLVAQHSITPPGPAPGLNAGLRGKWLPGERSISSPMHTPLLAELIRTGDPDAFAGFKDAHYARVRSYCEQTCRSELIEEACEASFVDFLGRLRGSTNEAIELQELLLKATRSASAGRSTAQRQADVDAMCSAVAELLAARANAEITVREELLSSHVEHCKTCRDTADRLKRAELLFAKGSNEISEEKWLPVSMSKTASSPNEPRITETPRDLPDGPDEANTAAEPPPATERGELRERPSTPVVPVARADPARRVVRRTGGLLGAAKRLARVAEPRRMR